MVLDIRNYKSCVKGFRDKDDGCQEKRNKDKKCDERGEGYTLSHTIKKCFSLFIIIIIIN